MSLDDRFLGVTTRIEGSFNFLDESHPGTAFFFYQIDSDKKDNGWT